MGQFQPILGGIAASTIMLFVVWMAMLAIPQAVGYPGLGDSVIWATLTTWVEFFTKLMVVLGILAAVPLFFFRG